MGDAAADGDPSGDGAVRDDEGAIGVGEGVSAAMVMVTDTVLVSLKEALVPPALSSAPVERATPRAMLTASVHQGNDALLLMMGGRP